MNLKAEEWDFRRVTADVIDDVLLWEYARESATIRAAVAKIYLAPTGPLKVVDRRDLFFCLNFTNDTNGWNQTKGGFFRVQLRRLITQTNAFPRPWLEISWDGVPWKFSPLVRQPIEEIFSSNGAAELKLDVLKVMLAEAHVFTIRWAALKNVESLVREFEKWARAEAKVRNLSGARGRSDSAKFSKLKWLAALRLSKLGIKDHKDAKSFIDSNLDRSIRGDHDVLPRFASLSAWRRAIDQAKRFAEKTASENFTANLKSILISRK